MQSPSASESFSCMQWRIGHLRKSASISDRKLKGSALPSDPNHLNCVAPYISKNIDLDKNQHGDPSTAKRLRGLGARFLSDLGVRKMCRFSRAGAS